MLHHLPQFPINNLNLSKTPQPQWAPYRALPKAQHVDHHNTWNWVIILLYRHSQHGQWKIHTEALRHSRGLAERGQEEEQENEQH